MSRMLRLNPGRMLLPASFAVAFVFALHGQTSTTSSDVTPENEEAIELSPFTVSAENRSRYQVSDATSSGRVRIALFDTPQSVSVLTREFIEDIGATRVLDAAKYVSGVTESTVPNGLDRVMIRGFQSDGHIVDGFRSISQANLDPAQIDRMEVVKGPNAIISPTGIPGGTINVISKKPLFRNFGSITAQVGRYDANRVEIDVNRAFGENAAFRFVASGQDSDFYWDDSFQRSWMVSPSASWRFGRDSTVTVQFNAHHWRSDCYLGIPIDPSVGPDDRARFLDGIESGFSPYNDDVRADDKLELRFFYTGSITERLATRVALRLERNDYWFRSTSIGGSAGGARNPFTGIWTPGVVYGPAPTFTPSPATTSRIYSRGGSYAVIPHDYFNLQNDFSYTLENENWKSTTLFGAAINRFSEQDFTIQTLTKPTFDIDNFTPAPYALTTLTQRVDDVSRDEQIYLQQTVEFLNGRLIVNGGVSRNWFDITAINRLTDVRRDVSVAKTLPNGGVVYKPVANVSLYYSYTKSASAPNPSNPRTNLQTGDQDEFGARFQFLNGRVLATVAYWDITQDNISIPHAGNLAVPPPNPPLPAIITDRVADGWEFEFNAALTDQMSLLGNFTTFRSRDPNGVPFRGVAEKSGGIWLHYRFTAGPLEGFAAGIGAHYTAERPGEQASGYAPGSTPEEPVANQPSFWLPSQTLVEASASYRVNEHWQVRAEIENLLDEGYMSAGLSRFLVFPGTPRNYRASVTYSF